MELGALHRTGRPALRIVVSLRLTTLASMSLWPLPELLTAPTTQGAPHRSGERVAASRLHLCGGRLAQSDTIALLEDGDDLVGANKVSVGQDRAGAVLCTRESRGMRETEHVQVEVVDGVEAGHLSEAVYQTPDGERAHGGIWKPSLLILLAAQTQMSNE
jgi:hypothetical protein